MIYSCRECLSTAKSWRCVLYALSRVCGRTYFSKFLFFIFGSIYLLHPTEDGKPELVLVIPSVLPSHYSLFLKPFTHSICFFVKKRTHCKKKSSPQRIRVRVYFAPVALLKIRISRGSTAPLLHCLVSATGL